MLKKVLIGGGLLVGGALFIKFILPELSKRLPSNAVSNVDLSGINFEKPLRDKEIDDKYNSISDLGNLQAWLKVEREKGNEIDPTFGGLPADFDFGFVF